MDVILDTLVATLGHTWYIWALVFLIALLRLFTPILKGYIGELAVRMALRSLPTKNYTAIHDVIVSADDHLTQIDHIIVARTGIFVIETKDYKGLITGSETAAKWTQHLGKKTISFHSPIRQNYGHIMALSAVLQLPASHFHSLIAFSAEAKVKVDCKTPVLTYGKLAKAIRGYTAEVLTEEEQTRIAQQIHAIRQQNKRLRRAQVRQARQRAEEKHSL